MHIFFSDIILVHVFFKKRTPPPTKSNEPSLMQPWRRGGETDQQNVIMHKAYYNYKKIQSDLPRNNAIRNKPIARNK